MGRYDESGVSTLGVLLGYNATATNLEGATSFTQLGRINAIGGVALSTEQIDSSALEDLVSKYIPGRQDTGGEWTVTVNTTDETLEDWGETIGGKTCIFEVYSPGLSVGFFIKAAVPAKVPMPEFSQNGLQTFEMSLTIKEYYGTATAVEPTEPSAGEP